jgi:hypothetical protein
LLDEVIYKPAQEWSPWSAAALAYRIVDEIRAALKR